MKDPRLHFYEAGTRELRFEQRSAGVPRVGDKVRFPSNRLVVVIDVEWSWPQPGSGDFRNQEGAWIDITFRDVCSCGHPRSEHYADRGECMASTLEETWACGCHEFDGYHAGEGAK